MDTEADALRQPNDTQTGGKSWGAQDSLRRNARLDMAADDSEATPLLGNGGSSAGSSVNETGGQEWEGAADFEGLTWWHTPSVSDPLSWAAISILMLVDVVVTSPFLHVLPRGRRSHGPETQPHPRTRMPEISAGVGCYGSQFHLCAGAARLR